MIDFKKVIVFIGCFFFLMSRPRAIVINCPEVASPGEVIKVKLQEDEFNGIKARYKFDTGLTYQGSKINTSWKSYYDGRDGFSVGNVKTVDKMSMDIDVLVGMNTEINRDYTIELIDIEANTLEYKSITLDNVSCKIRVLSDVNTLDSLSVDGVVFNSKFDKNITNYQGSTKSDKIVIKAVASDGNAKIEGDMGEKNLKLGVNSFSIKVTSSRGNVREYKLYITRTVDKKSSDVTLKKLSLSSGKIDFDKNKFLYLVDVGYDVESIDVEAIANDSKALVIVEKPDKLVVGDNNINVIVTAEDGTTVTYVIVVNRNNKLSSDAGIKNLFIKNYDIKFKSDVYDYDLEIDGEDSLDIEVVLSDDRSKYVIDGNSKLKNDSIIKIKVTAENGAVKVYKIKIKKLSEENSSSIGNYIKVVPLIGFVILIVLVLIVKIINSRVVKNS